MVFGFLYDVHFEEWAKKQKRITNKMLRDKYDLTEEEADEAYYVLKKMGIVGHMGYTTGYLNGEVKE